MSATPEPVALAREVLALAHEDETVTVCTIPDNTVAALARAVLDLTARLDHERFAHATTAAALKHVKNLADRLAEIRAALNGEHHE